MGCSFHLLQLIRRDSNCSYWYGRLEETLQVSMMQLSGVAGLLDRTMSLVDDRCYSMCAVVHRFSPDDQAGLSLCRPLGDMVMLIDA